MFRHLENEQEKEVREFAKMFCKFMGWPKIKIARFKIGRMNSYRGYCLVVRKNKLDKNFIFISSNPNVYNSKEISYKEFWSVVVHELVHIYLYETRHTVEQAFGHGKKFIKVCESIQKKTNGYFTVKGLVK